MEFQIDPTSGNRDYNNYNDPIRPSDNSGNNGGKVKVVLIIIIALLILALIGAGIWFAMINDANKKAIEEERLAREQAELDRDQSLMNRDFEDLNEQFAMIEQQSRLIQNDSMRQDITEKYRAAKKRMEQLQREVTSLQNDKNRNAEEIRGLRAEIESLRSILRTYVDQINQLNEENRTLRAENTQVREDNARLSTQVEETSRTNAQLTERVTLAEKLNVTGVSFQALNKKGKVEKKVEKATQLVTTFTIPQNNSTPVGEKVIYMRIMSPSGQVLGASGTFSFEGASVAYTARKAVEYSGEEIPGIRIYWDVNTALTPGTYTVELFTGNYRLTSRSFTLN